MTTAQISPEYLTSDDAGNLYFYDYSAFSIRKVDPSGGIARFAGGGSSFCGVGSMCGAATNANLGNVAALATDLRNVVYILDSTDEYIWSVDDQDAISVFAQPVYADGTAQMSIDPQGDAIVLLSAYGGSLATFGPNQQANLDNSFHPYRTQFSGLTVDRFGNQYVSEFGTILRRNQDGSVVQIFDIPLEPEYPSYLFPMTTDSAGTLYFVDQLRNRIFKIENAGTCDNHEPLVASVGSLNAASYQWPIAPGSIVTIFGQHIGPDQPVEASIVGGRFPTIVGNTRVLFDGIAAPLVYVSSGQVSAIAPYAIAGDEYTTITLEVNGVASSTVYTTVLDSAPGIFTQNGSGNGTASVLNQDNSLNTSTNPAAKGSIISVYATGEGLTDPAGVDGLIAGATPPKPILPVTATIDGQLADVVYAGGAPFEVAGVLQVNIRVPATASSGAAIPIKILVGTQPSQGGVTIAIQ